MSRSWHIWIVLLHMSQSLKRGREAGVFWELKAARKQNKSAGLEVRDRGHIPDSEPSVVRRSPTVNSCFSISSSKMSVLLGRLCDLSQVQNCVFLCNISFLGWIQAFSLWILLIRELWIPEFGQICLNGFTGCFSLQFLFLPSSCGSFCH